MSKIDKLEVQFGESGEESLRSYRSIHRTAVVGLSLGVLSVFTLVHWLLLPIAIAAILVSAVALRQIAARSDEFVGRKAALMGIALALFFLGFVATREISRRSTMSRQARQHADQWLQLLQKGDLPSLYNAFELQQRYSERQKAGTDLSLRYGDPKEFDSVNVLSMDPELLDSYMPRSTFHRFLNTPAVKQVIESGPGGELRFESVAARNHSKNNDIVTLEYSLHDQSDGQPRATRLFIKMSRNFDIHTHQGHWNVVTIGKSLEDI